MLSDERRQLRHDQHQLAAVGGSDGRLMRSDDTQLNISDHALRLQGLALRRLAEAYRAAADTAMRDVQFTAGERQSRHDYYLAEAKRLEAEARKCNRAPRRHWDIHSKGATAPSNALSRSGKELMSLASSSAHTPGPKDCHRRSPPLLKWLWALDQITDFIHAQMKEIGQAHQLFVRLVRNCSESKLTAYPVICVLHKLDASKLEVDAGMHYFPLHKLVRGNLPEGLKHVLAGIAKVQVSSRLRVAGECAFGRLSELKDRYAAKG